MDTKKIAVGVGTMSRTPEFFKELFPGSRAIIVADTNTWKAAGETVYGYLRDGGVEMDEPFILDDPDLFAEWGYLEQVENHLKGTDATAVAVGSGVINDLTKLASGRLGRKYMVVGTAASMDGYTASGASITFEGIKQTFGCPAPQAAILDPEVAAKAPVGMTASGYADLLAKVPAGAEWMIADALGIEKIHDEAFHLVQDKLKLSLSKPSEAAAGEVAPTELLSEGLIMSGFAMQACGSSRPASGTEHQFSHYWDMDGLCFNGKHVSHGFKVGVGTVISTRCIEFLLDYDIDTIDPNACAAAWKGWDEQVKVMEKLFEGRPAHLARALEQYKAKFVDADEVRNEVTIFKKIWPELAPKIREQIFPSAEVKEKLKAVGAPYAPEMIGISKERLFTTFLGVPYMRSRFFILDLICRCGLQDKVVDYLKNSYI